MTDKIVLEKTIKITLDKKFKPENSEYYVRIFFNDEKSLEKNYPKLNELIDNYHHEGRGDPLLGLPMVPENDRGHYAVIFKTEGEINRFTNDIKKLDYIKELRTGKIVTEYK